LQEAHEQQLRKALGESVWRKLKRIQNRQRKESGIHAEAVVAIEAEVKRLVLEHGESVKGESLYAVWSNGHRVWNKDMLDGFCIAHPELKEALSIGEPFVTIREMKK
jgi:hypothetical protein